VSFNTNSQDLIHNEFRVYIEGVQIPFESATVNQAYKELPTATITVPPFPGLQDIGRNYFPKVHIFYKDFNFSIPESYRHKVDRDELRDSWKLLFTGMIKGVEDNKHVGSDGGSQNITLHAGSELELISQILIKFANERFQEGVQALGQTADGANVVGEFNSHTAVIKALGGISDTTDESDVRHIPEGKFEDLKGTPGILKVFWNILKRDAEREVLSNDTEAMREMYVPLIEEGLKLWEFMSGHPEIEEGIASEKFEYKIDDPRQGLTDEDFEVMIPSTFKTFISDKAQVSLAVQAMKQNHAAMPSDMTGSLGHYFTSILNLLEYDMIELPAPVSKEDGGLTKYVVKPQMPYYYSPICNVVLPSLISSVSTRSNYGDIPTRMMNIANIADLLNGPGHGIGKVYTSPHSVRKARSPSGNLGNTFSVFNNKVGKYEWGRGIVASVLQVPPLYNLLGGHLKKGSEEETLDKNTSASKATAEAAWNAMYPGDEQYNPYSTDSGIDAWDRMNFLYTDLKMAQATATARIAQASGVFNPYPIVGYPMDFVDQVASRDSYHGFCTSITHSFSASGNAETSYSMASVSTYSELAYHNLPAINPYLMTALSLDENPRLYGNAKAYAKACKVYLDVFGIGAAEPALLQDYRTGEPNPFTRTPSSGGCWTTESDTTGGVRFETTTRGSLALVARNITSLIELEKLSGNTFIDIDDWIYATSTDVSLEDHPGRVEVESAKIITPGSDAESSPFLDY